jgi:hypothetical protein
MEKNTYLKLFAAFIFMLSCSEDFLNEKPKTEVPTLYFLDSPEGLKTLMVGLYDQNRDIYNNIEAENTRTLYLFVLHDLVVAWDSYLRIIARWAPNNAHNPYNYGSKHLGFIWKHHYGVIERANIIIEGLDKVLSINEEDSLRIRGEALVFRSNSLLILWQMFNNVYIKTEATTPQYAAIRVEYPNTKEEILTQLSTDLDLAIECLDWTYNQPGRITKAMAYHLRAKVALWQEDWQKAAACSDSIIINKNYELVKIDEVFNGDRNHK